jgi:hypothetical protein
MNGELIFADKEVESYLWLLSMFGIGVVLEGKLINYLIYNSLGIDG